MKKLGILLVMLSFLLTGCVRIPSLQDMAVVQGVGVDYEDGEYQLTLQVFSAEGSGGQTILDPSQQNASTITCRGGKPDGCSFPDFPQSGTALFSGP